ncbi:uncharacterized protein LOC119573429 [Penaeus monodon]|uniref:uncharacterized protein LOC119573429 n=1 Tax=Penaeus monodon TaxID=6687 RepID=UPI0018A6D9CC|nr:uncharacterized protein LOC119573429 [Penaeus monodon]
MDASFTNMDKSYHNLSLSLAIAVVADQTSHVTISLDGAPALITVPFTTRALYTTISIPTTHSLPTIHNLPTTLLPLITHSLPMTEYHYEKLLPLYADVAELIAELSVDRPNTLDKETYLCPSETAYILPLRAQNSILPSSVPDCYKTKCLRKFIYHRFLVYDLYDQYFLFAAGVLK